MEEKVVLRISTEGGLPDNRQMYKSKTQNEFISAARSKFPSNKLYSKVLFVRLSLLKNSYSSFHD